MKVPGKPRRVEIDFVRGCAILMVMFVHFRVPVTGVAVLDKFKRFFGYIGGHGVPLFFVLSGFLVGGLLLQEYKKTGDVRVRRFLVRRLFKIWPPLYFLLLFHVIIRHHPIKSFLWQNLLEVQNYVNNSLAQTWSLAVEEHFYLVLPVILWFVAKRRWSGQQTFAALAAVAAIFFVWRTVVIFTWTDYLDHAHRTQYNFDSLMFGVLISVMYHFLPKWYAAISARAWPLMLITLAGMAATQVPRTVHNEVFDNPLSYLACGSFLVLMMEHSGRMTRTLPYRAISTVGVYSYGLYLWHSFGLEAGDWCIVHFSPVKAWLVGMTVQMVAALVLGYVTTRVVEWPFLLWRERIRGLSDPKPLIDNPDEGPLKDGLVTVTEP